MDDKVLCTGEVTILINGVVRQVIPNLVVTAGLGWLVSRANANTDAVMSHMAIGDSATAAAIGDTALGNEISRNALNVAGGTVASNVITFECTWAADDPNVTAPATTTITEAGILNAASGGTLLAHTVFTAVNKGETDSMTISWSITVG